MDRDTPNYHGRDLTIFATQHPKLAIPAASTSDLGTETWTDFPDFTQNHLAQQAPNSFTSSPIAAVTYLQCAQPGYQYPSPSQQYQYGTSSGSQRSPGSQNLQNAHLVSCSIPGQASEKRQRRRYEDIDRMYKCGWQVCEKAYGTLNHLNAHVMMQSHGIKRSPEEFKEIRKEWKQRKKGSAGQDY